MTSEETPEQHTKRLATTHTPLGSHPLWNRPAPHDHLPDYVENVASALMKGGMGESQAVATALSEMHKWAHPAADAKVRPEVTSAALSAEHEWKLLKDPKKTLSNDSREHSSTFGGSHRLGE